MSFGNYSYICKLPAILKKGSFRWFFSELSNCQTKRHTHLLSSNHYALWIKNMLPYDGVGKCQMVFLVLDKIVLTSLGFLDGSVGKESTCNARDTGLISGLGRSPEGGNGNPLQYSCLKNSMDRGAWWITVQSVAKSQTRLSN